MGAEGSVARSLDPVMAENRPGMGGRQGKGLTCGPALAETVREKGCGPSCRWDREERRECGLAGLARSGMMGCSAQEKREMESEGEVGRPDVAQEGEGEGFPFSFCKFIL